MKIGIIGSGNMGRVLGGRLSEQGHDVFFGARTKSSAEFARDQVGGNSEAGSLEEAVSFGDVLVYTIRELPGDGVSLDPSLFNGKTIIDLNNAPIPEGFEYAPVVESHAEKLQQTLPGAEVVKAFNMLAMEAFEVPKDVLKTHNVSVLLAGDHTEAKKHVMHLIDQMGFTPIDSGNLRSARLLESAADLIRQLMMGAKLGAMAHLSVGVLPQPKTLEFGGRQASNYH